MADVYQLVTDAIIRKLELGNIPWHCPWRKVHSSCISYATGKPYSMLNQMLLGGRPGEYITFNQAIAVGGHVRKGERAKLVVFWKMFETVDADTGEVTEIPMLKYYNVFNIDQCEHIAPRWAITLRNEQSDSDLIPDEKADCIILDYLSRSKVKFSPQRTNSAYYSASTDEIVVPELKQYDTVPEFYSSAFHEIAHSTGHPARLNRFDGTERFASEEYSKEELIAEIASAFMLDHCGLNTHASFENNVAYIQGWLKALRNNRKLIVTAASHAEKACKYILGESTESEVATNV